MARLGYVSVGVNDLERASAFYDALLGDLGGKRLFPTANGIIYGLGDGAMIMITRPYDGQPAQRGNGVMLALMVDSKEDVAATHAKALTLGGVCEGPPGPRGSFGEFAYFRDLDGNKIAAFHTSR